MVAVARPRRTASLGQRCGQQSLPVRSVGAGGQFAAAVRAVGDGWGWHLPLPLLVVTGNSRCLPEPPVLPTTARTRDVLNPDAGQVVRGPTAEPQLLVLP
jgi:hypothetical protein